MATSTSRRPWEVDSTRTAPPKQLPSISALQYLLPDRTGASDGSSELSGPSSPEYASSVAPSRWSGATAYDSPYGLSPDQMHWDDKNMLGTRDYSLRQNQTGDLSDNLCFDPDDGAQPYNRSVGGASPFLMMLK